MYIIQCILYVYYMYISVCVSMSENGISQKRYDNSGENDDLSWEFGVFPEILRQTHFDITLW